MELQNGFLSFEFKGVFQPSILLLQTSCEQWPPQDQTFRETSSRPKFAVGHGVSWLTTIRPSVDWTSSAAVRASKRASGSNHVDWTPSSSVSWQGIDRPVRQARLQTGSITTEFRYKVLNFSKVNLSQKKFHSFLCRRFKN
jgi:hypothetical protein